MDNHHRRHARKPVLHAPESPEAPKRLFSCAHPGCGRSFTRSEHLHRHSLNHTDGNATCQRCRAHFKRKDLLERHLARHRQKDEEAGGEGTGQLNTRKRMWKDHDGRIVQKKPKQGVLVESPLAGSDYDRVSQEPDHPSVDSPVSPSPSSRSEVLDYVSDQGSSRHLVLAEGHMAQSYKPSPDPYEAQAYVADAWVSPEVPQSFASAQYDMAYEASPQTSAAAVPFSTTYTTQPDSNWGYGLTTANTSASLDPRLSAAYSATSSRSVASSPDMNTLTSVIPQQPLLSSTGRYPPAAMPRSHHTPVGHAQELRAALASEATALGYNSVPVDYENPANFARQTRSPLVLEYEMYGRVLQTIQTAAPRNPDGSFLNLSQPLLSPAALQSYLDAFFTKFHTAYSLLYQATLGFQQVDPLLMLAVILLGASYSSKEAHQLAVCLYHFTRPLIFSHASLDPKPAPWVLQTILLVELFGKTRLSPAPLQGIEMGPFPVDQGTKACPGPTSSSSSSRHRT